MLLNRQLKGLEKEIKKGKDVGSFGKNVKKITTEHILVGKGLDSKERKLRWEERTDEGFKKRGMEGKGVLWPEIGKVGNRS